MRKHVKQNNGNYVSMYVCMYVVCLCLYVCIIVCVYDEDVKGET